MKKLNAKRVKRHMLRTSEFWQLDEKFLVISPDKKLCTLTGMESLPESDTGYLGYAYLDDTLRVAFLGFCNEEDETYKFFDSDQVLVAQASMLPTLLVRIVKPTEELEKHPFVQGVLEFHESDALRRSTLALRQIDHLRDPLRPAILKAVWIKDEVELEKTYNESVEQFLEVLVAAYEQAEKDGIRARDVEVEGEPGPLPVDAMSVEFVRITDFVPANNGTWRAVLLDNIPGTNKKKKGDDVAVSLVTTTFEEDGQNYSMLFIEIDAPIEDTKINVASFKPSRLPWRIAYTLACSVCDFKDTYYLGRSGEDRLMFKEIIEEIRRGRIDPLIAIDLVQRDDCEIDFSRELYRCRSCGTLDVKRRVRLITKEHTLSAMYYCLECGERMSHVKRGHIASLDCPQCREQLKPVEEALWDGVNPH
jgi:predicted SprT family Zn-dependent metalloprotease